MSPRCYHKWLQLEPNCAFRSDADDRDFEPICSRENRWFVEQNDLARTDCDRASSRSVERFNRAYANGWNIRASIVIFACALQQRPTLCLTQRT